MTTKRNIFSNIRNIFFPKEEKVTIIAVLGMHRSGTSCLTGLLEDAGVCLGDVSKKNPYNLKGNQENLRIMHMHDAVLADNEAAWDSPPSNTVLWNEERKKELKTIVTEYAGEHLWAFKDPRALFTLGGWLELLPALKLIGTFRHPTAVAQSLHKRGQMPQEKAFDLWLHYNRRLLHYHAKFGFDIVNFNLESAAYRQCVSQAFKGLDISHSLDDFCFFDSSLRHATIDDSVELPPEVRMIYNELLEASS